MQIATRRTDYVSSLWAAFLLALTILLLGSSAGCQSFAPCRPMSCGPYGCSMSCVPSAENQFPYFDSNCQPRLMGESRFRAYMGVSPVTDPTAVP